jgi:predicted PurR-regulated permease PerM
VRDAMMIAGVIGLLYLGKVLSVVTVPMLLALLLAYLFEPLIRRAIVTRHVSRQGAALAIIVLAGLLILIPLVVGSVVGIAQTATLAGNIAQKSGDLLKSIDEQATESERLSARSRLQGSFWTWSSDNLNELREQIRDYRLHRDTVRSRTHSGSDRPKSPITEPQPANPPRSPTQNESKAVDPEARANDGANKDQEDPAVPEPGANPPESTPEINTDDPHALRDAYDMPAWKEQLYGVLDASIVWLRTNSSQVAQTLGKQAIGGGAQILQSAIGVLKSLGFVVFGAFLTAFFFYFFSTGWGRVLEFWEGLIPERRKGLVIDLLQKMDRVIAGFVRGRLTICFILSIYMTIAYALIGVPSAFVLGPIVGLLFIVPFAHVIGVPIAMLLMSLQPSEIAWQNEWWWIVFAPLGVYMGAQFFDDYILSPMIQGKATNMDTPTILFASLAGGALGGVYGLLLAIPVAACIKILAQEIFWPRFRDWAQGKKPDFLPIEN